MSAAAASRIVLYAFSAATLGLVVYASGPWGGREPGDMLVTLSLLPLFASFAVGPYVLAHRQATAAASPAQEWMFAVLAAAVGAPAIAVYLDAFILSDTLDAQAGVVFVVMPAYQYIIIGAVMGFLRLLRKLRGGQGSGNGGSGAY